MSIRKPIFKVTKKCIRCNGQGKIYPDILPSMAGVIFGFDCRIKCERCKGFGKIDVSKKDSNFKQHYIENLKEVVEYWTRLYRNKNREAQE